MVREKTNLRLLAMAGIALLFGLVATPVTAQVRFVDGFITGTWSEFEPIGANALTTTVVTAGGQTCGPLVAPCAGRPYPGLAGGAQIEPANTGGAVLWGGTAQGDAIQMPGSQWTLSTMGTLPSGVLPSIQSIMSAFRGRNSPALAASGNGWSAGGGPGNYVANPAAAGIPSSTYQIRTFAGATSALGSTTAEGNNKTVTFPSLPVMTDANLRMQGTAGPRQFGGTVKILTEQPNRLTLIFPTGLVDRTNGRCPPSYPFGECSAAGGGGFEIGGDTGQVGQSARVYKFQALPVTLTGHYRWYGQPWTTGTVSIAQKVTAGSSSFGRTGTDVGGSSRHLVMVTPILGFGQGLAGLGGVSILWTWDITYTPEPGAAMGLLAGVGMLGLLYTRRQGR